MWSFPLLCAPFFSSPRPFRSLRSEWVSLSSRELDLGVKTQRRGGSQKDCSWPCAGLGRSAPWGLLCLPGMDMRCGTSHHPEMGCCPCSEGPRGPRRPHGDCLFLLLALPFFHSPGPTASRVPYIFATNLYFQISHHAHKMESP